MIPWTITVLICTIFLIFICLYSLLFEKQGNYNNYFDSPKIKYSLDSDISTSLKFVSKGEAECKKCLEGIFGVEFKNVRLNEIKNPNTNKNLEIDCYNPELKIGVEFHGINHYKFIPFFHKTFDAFRESQLRDEFKELTCKKLGILLIIVPYNTKLENICSFILNELKRFNRVQHLTGW